MRDGKIVSDSSEDKNGEAGDEAGLSPTAVALNSVR